jgi:hypothetical protein
MAVISNLENNGRISVKEAQGELIAIVYGKELRISQETIKMVNKAFPDEKSKKWFLNHTIAGFTSFLNNLESNGGA